MRCAGLAKKLMQHLGMSEVDATAYVSNLERRVEAARTSGSPEAMALDRKQMLKDLLASDAKAKVIAASEARLREYRTLSASLTGVDNSYAMARAGMSVTELSTAQLVGVQMPIKGAQDSVAAARNSIQSRFLGPLSAALIEEHGWYQKLIETSRVGIGPSRKAAQKELDRINPLLAEELLKMRPVPGGGAEVRPGAAAPKPHGIAGKGDEAVRKLAQDLFATGVRFQEAFSLHGVPVAPMAGHIPQPWDAAKIRMQKAQFETDLFNAVNWDHKAYAGLTPMERQEFIKEVAESLVTGSKGAPAAKEGGGVSKNITGHRQVFLKQDAQTWIDTMGKYGRTTNVMEAYMNKFAVDARELSLVQKLGPNYRSGMVYQIDTMLHALDKGDEAFRLNVAKELPGRIENLRDDEAYRGLTRDKYVKLEKELQSLMERQAKGEDVTAATAELKAKAEPFELYAKKRARDNLEGFRSYVAEGREAKSGSLEARAWAVVTGAADEPGNVSWAKINNDIRAWVSMSMLGRAVFSALADTGNMWHVNRHAGQGAFQAWGNVMGNLLEGAKFYFKHEASSPEVAHMLAGFHENMIGSVYSRFVGEDVGRMAGAMERYFRLNLLTPWTEASRAGAAISAAEWLGTNAGKRWTELNKGLAEHLTRVGFDEGSWDLVRKGLQDVGGKQMILPETAMAAIMDGDIEHLVRARMDAIGKTAVGVDESIIRDHATKAVRYDLHDLVERYIHQEVQHAVIGTTDAVKAHMGKVITAPKGTVAGEIQRYIMQFKSFPIAQIYHTMGMTWGGKTFAEGAIHGGSTIFQMGLLGGVAMLLKDLAKGDTPKDYSRPGTWVQALMQGGGFGLYGDFLLGNFSRFGQSPGELLAGPVVSGPISMLLNNFTPNAAAEGMNKGGEKYLTGILKDVIRNTPYVNLFYVKPVLDTVAFNPMFERLQPGILALQDRNKYKQFGQRSWTAPATRELYGR